MQCLGFLTCRGASRAAPPGGTRRKRIALRFVTEKAQNTLRATDTIGEEKGRFLKFRVFAAREKKEHQLPRQISRRGPLGRQGSGRQIEACVVREEGGCFQSRYASFKQNRKTLFALRIRLARKKGGLLYIFFSPRATQRDILCRGQFLGGDRSADKAAHAS